MHCAGAYGFERAHRCDLNLGIFLQRGGGVLPNPTTCFPEKICNKRGCGVSPYTFFGAFSPKTPLLAMSTQHQPYLAHSKPF